MVDSAGVLGGQLWSPIWSGEAGDGQGRRGRRRRGGGQRETSEPRALRRPALSCEASLLSGGALASALGECERACVCVSARVCSVSVRRREHRAAHINPLQVNQEAGNQETNPSRRFQINKPMKARGGGQTQQCCPGWRSNMTGRDTNCHQFGGSRLETQPRELI